MNTLITARQFRTQDGQTLYMADGPDGHLSLLARGTPEAAERDGAEYFLRTRDRIGGVWYIAGSADWRAELARQLGEGT